MANVKINELPVTMKLIANAPSMKPSVWQRNTDGFMLGALAINFIVTGSSLIFTFAIGVVASYPDIAIFPVLISTVAVTLIVGIFGYPISYTTWLAIDLMMRPLEPGEQANTSKQQ